MQYIVVVIEIEILAFLIPEMKALVGILRLYRFLCLCRLAAEDDHGCGKISGIEHGFFTISCLGGADR